MKQHSTLLALAILLAATGPGLAAQTDAKPDQSASNQTIETMAAFNVRDVPLDEQIMPTTRPISGVLGYDAGILDIPRSVTTIDK